MICYYVKSALLRILRETHCERTSANLKASVKIIVMCYILGCYTLVIRNLSEIGAASEGGVRKEEHAGGDAEKDRRDSGRSNIANLGNEIRVCIKKHMSLLIFVFVLLLHNMKYLLCSIPLLFKDITLGY